MPQKSNVPNIVYNVTVSLNTIESKAIKCKSLCQESGKLGL